MGQKVFSREKKEKEIFYFKKHQCFLISLYAHKK